mmetsp:Transcript_9594/g.34053  ORF Transcript_9594/g.34053 Transcript_9594/m.34053 type:complete len:242 (+) Transcript_9594:488-1213(+)
MASSFFNFSCKYLVWSSGGRALSDKQPPSLRDEHGQLVEEEVRALATLLDDEARDDGNRLREHETDNRKAEHGQCGHELQLSLCGLTDIQVSRRDAFRSGQVLLQVDDVAIPSCLRATVDDFAEVVAETPRLVEQAMVKRLQRAATELLVGAPASRRQRCRGVELRLPIPNLKGPTLHEAHDLKAAVFRAGHARIRGEDIVFRVVEGRQPTLRLDSTAPRLDLQKVRDADDECDDDDEKEE